MLLIDSKTGKLKCNFKDTFHDHWDLDMVGNPIITKIKNGTKFIDVVFSFSKTGNIFIINLDTCKKLSSNVSKKILTDTKTDIPDQTYSSYQNKTLNPENIMNMSYNLDEYKNFIKNDKDKLDYIKFKTRNSRHSQSYIPLGINHDVIMFGIHGGFEWPGGTLDIKNRQIILPSNHYPWIIRSYYHKTKDSKISDFKKYFIDFQNKESKNIYESKCQSCHGKNREGVYQNEFFGDNYIPSLIGLSLTNKFNSIKSEKNFKYSHQYASEKIKINNDELKLLRKYFKKLDESQIKDNVIGVKAKWQLILDDKGVFASKPPFGKLTAWNLDSGKINWSRPFGEKIINENLIKGDINFGGVMATQADLTFATGTPDKYLRVINSTNGETIWKYKMKVAGSAPPMTFKYNNEQYIIVNASGGRYYGFDRELGDYIYAFKIIK